MRRTGWPAWLMLAASACRWGFAKEPLDASTGDGDDATDAGGAAKEICTDHWCWERAPAPEARSLRAIDGSSAANVWAVGDGGVIRRWGGASWVVVESPTNDALTAVDVVGDNDVTIAAGAGVLWHYDGTTWTKSELASKSSVAALWRAPDNKLWEAGDIGTISVDGVAAAGVPAGYATTALDGNAVTNVWQAGKFNAVSRWNGTSWGSTLIADFPTSVLAKGTGAFVGGTGIWSCDMALACTQVFANAYARDILSVADNSLWAVGSLGNIEHYDGVSWTTVTSPTTASLNGLWGSGADDIWAVGDDGTILHYTGSSGPGWTSVSGDKTPEPVWVSLWVAADDDRWIGGGDSTMWHDDGSALVPVSLPGGTLLGDEIEGNGPSDIYALDFGNHGVIHYDGSAWTLDPSLIALSSTGGGLATSGTETLASNVVGDVYRKPAGGSFSQTYTLGGTEWHGICLEPNGDAVVVGRFGSASIRTSGTWAVHNPPTGRYMVACSYAGSAGWGIGGDTLLKLSGTTWTNLGTMSKTTQNLDDVLAVSDSEAYVVATNGRIVGFNGSEWTEEASPIAADIHKLSRSPSGTIYAVGHSPGILRRR